MHLFKLLLGFFSLMMMLMLINAGYAYNPSSDSSQIAYYRGQMQTNRQEGGYQGGERRYEPYGEQGRGMEPYHGAEQYHGYPEGYHGYPEGYRGAYPEYNRGYQAPVVVPQQQPVYVVPPQTTMPLQQTPQ